jgi:hypothetical protein
VIVFHGVLARMLTSLLKNLTRGALLIALFARIAVPAGFMPGDASEGWFLQLCPDGLAPASVVALLGAHHQHNYHAEDDQAEYDADCVLSGLTLAALPYDNPALPVDANDIGPIQTPLAPAAESAPARAYRSRAPPIA